LQRCVGLFSEICRVLLQRYVVLFVRDMLDSFAEMCRALLQRYVGLFCRDM